MGLLERALLNVPEHIALDVKALKAELAQTRRNIAPVTMPRLYWVETTTRCNLHCPYCPRTYSGLGERGTNRTMTVPALNAILHQMPQVRSVELFGYGDPFMLPNLHEYVSLCTKRGITVVLATNLLAATLSKIDALFFKVANPVYPRLFLVIDVDSLDSERYLQLRAGAPANGLARLRRLVRYVLSHPSRSYVHVVLQSIRHGPEPEYTDEQLLEWTGGLRPDEIRHRFFDTFRGTATSPQKDRPPEGMWRLRRQPESVCREAFYGFAIHANGDVVVCNRDWAGENIMGNIFTENAQNIWHGKPYKLFRQAMKSLNKPAMCLECPEGQLVNYRSQPTIQLNMLRGREVWHVT